MNNCKRGLLRHTIIRVIWSILLLLHAWVMIDKWWWNAHGFPVGHSRFWGLEALPLMLSAFCVLGIVSVWLRRDGFFRIFILIMPVTYAVVAISSRVVFPVSSATDLCQTLGAPWPFRWGFWLPMLGWAGVLGLFVIFTNGRRRLPSLPVLAAVAAGIASGVLLTWSCRAEDPSTHPWGQALPAVPGAVEPVGEGQGPFAADMTVDAVNGQVTLKCRNLEIKVQPLLTFLSTSPDRCWTELAPERETAQPDRWLMSARRHQGDWYFQYEGARPALMCIKHRREGDPLEIEVWTELPQPVFSHLNFFSCVTVRNQKWLELSFSPCPKHRVKVSDPAWIDQQFGYLDDSGRFNWAKGTWEEKGPFHELASGPLNRGDPLAIVLSEEGRDVCRVVLEDWSSQSSTALSPTAGWGVPANAIVPVVGPEWYGTKIYFQLAATHVGAGSDTVGHTAGVYRSRIRIEPLADPCGGTLCDRGDQESCTD